MTRQDSLNSCEVSSKEFQSDQQHGQHGTHGAKEIEVGRWGDVMEMRVGNVSEAGLVDLDAR